jgi:hypothetical protein
VNRRQEIKEKDQSWELETGGEKEGRGMDRSYSRDGPDDDFSM